MSPLARTRLALAALVAVASSAGCAVGPDYARPDAPKAGRYDARDPKTTSADGQEQRFREGAKISADWWRLLGSEKLSGVVVDALANNPGLEAAQASLRKSEDGLRAGYGVFFPQVGGKAGVSQQKYNPAPGTLPSSVFNLFTLSASVSYAVDVWGGQRRAVEGLSAQVDAQRFTLVASYVMLSANVVNTVIAQAAYRDQVEITRAALAIQRDQLRITEAQVEAGTAPQSTAFSIRSQIATTEATIPPLEQKVDQAEHLLATLVGRAPSEWREPVIALSDVQLPADLPLTVPSLLVRQRPDVLVAEAQVHAANAGIGVATAAMLPTLTLSAGYGVNNPAAADLFSSKSTVGNVGAGVAAPIFDGGTLWYQRRQAIDAHDQALALYRQTVLAAFAQVADTLRALEHDGETLRAEREAVDAAEGALRLVQANYAAGITGYLQVLTADGQYLQAKIGHSQARAQRLQDTVALYTALGGGWWNAAKPIAPGS
jgi:NodT family efflux transporter outer membrane factor (OMF) lipoprotein